MSDRLTYYFRQKITEDELNEGFALLEQAMFDLARDQGFSQGVLIGLDVVPATPPNFTVSVLAGSAYDAQGRRCFVPMDETVDVSVDENSVRTTVMSSGNERWLSIFVEFDRELSDPRTDGRGESVYFRSAEGFRLRVVQNLEAAIGTAPRPALDPNAVLLADIRLVHAQQFVNVTDIDLSRRMVVYSQKRMNDLVKQVQQTVANLNTKNIQSDDVVLANTTNRRQIMLAAKPVWGQLQTLLDITSENGFWLDRVRSALFEADNATSKWLYTISWSASDAIQGESWTSPPPFAVNAGSVYTQLKELGARLWTQIQRVGSSSSLSNQSLVVDLQGKAERAELDPIRSRVAAGWSPLSTTQDRSMNLSGTQGVPMMITDSDYTPCINFGLNDLLDNGMVTTLQSGDLLCFYLPFDRDSAVAHTDGGLSIALPSSPNSAPWCVYAQIPELVTDTTGFAGLPTVNLAAGPATFTITSGAVAQNFDSSGHRSRLHAITGMPVRIELMTLFGRRVYTQEAPPPSTLHNACFLTVPKNSYGSGSVFLRVFRRKSTFVA